ncbi:hypothetical protein [Kutzneria sp. CA-103260]|uniref:hypothetical protein n=1 Tax=Kutzneria sp. CA-103260 TaxID=2802641 RepID=UPI001BAC3CD9|nr:hypothetical protein [Kutzneria sp. CA-103260]
MRRGKPGDPDRLPGIGQSGAERLPDLRGTGSIFAPYYAVTAAAVVGLTLVPLLRLAVRRDAARDDNVTPLPTPA